MKQVSIVFQALLLTFSMHSISVADEKILRVGADPWCPYNCNENDEHKGYLIDIAKSIFEPQGYKVTYGNMPWRRALLEVENGNLDAVVGVVEGNRGNLLLNRIPLGKDETVMAVRNGDRFAYSGPHSLAGKQLGVIADYTYDNNGELDAYLENLKTTNPSLINILYHEDALDSLFFMLQQKRIDLFFENKVIARYAAQQLGIIDDFEFIDTQASDDIHFGFKNNQKGHALADILDEGISQLILTGQLTELKKKYNLK